MYLQRTSIRLQCIWLCMYCTLYTCSTTHAQNLCTCNVTPLSLLSRYAENSPEPQQRAATHLGHTPRSPDKGWRNPFSNLRRTQSHKTSRSQHTRTKVNVPRVESSSQSSESLSSTSSSSRLELTVPLIEEEHGSPESTEAAAQLSSDVHHNLGQDAVSSNREQCGSQTVATPTSLTCTSDTDSIRTYGSERTLVEMSTTADGGSGTTATTTDNTMSLRQELLSLPPTRHKQTCSSLDSEGLGSLASEEIEEAGPQDWTQWSKEVSNHISRQYMYGVVKCVGFVQCIYLHQALYRSTLHAGLQCSDVVTKTFCPAGLGERTGSHQEQVAEFRGRVEGCERIFGQSPAPYNGN